MILGGSGVQIRPQIGTKMAPKASWRRLGASWGRLGAGWGVLGASWGRLESVNSRLAGLAGTMRPSNGAARGLKLVP